jgi:hypothetical protein
LLPPPSIFGRGEDGGAFDGGNIGEFDAVVDGVIRTSIVADVASPSLSSSSLSSQSGIPLFSVVIIVGSEVIITMTLSSSMVMRCDDERK